MVYEKDGWLTVTAARLIHPFVLISCMVCIQNHSRLPPFRDVAKDAGVLFQFDRESRGQHDLPEIMGGGVALIDYDGDGFLDIFFCNGGPIMATPKLADPPCRLFRNLGGWRFSDVTESAHVPGPSYAMGVAVGDYDHDGRADLFVTGWRDQRLYRNLGTGKFADVTEKAGLTSKLWSTSAAFADLDGDGDLDLYVCNYLDFDPIKAPFCSAPDGKRDYCGPEEFDAQPDCLYQNNGDGTFVEIAKGSGIDDNEGRGLGVLIADLVGDSKPDIFVTNDGTACRLYENRSRMQFVEVGLKSGVAFDRNGQALAGMGIACGDVDGDSRLDLLVSNFLGRSTIAFLNQGDGLFSDSSATIGLAARTRSVLGFGLALEDFDGDGDLDLIQANGHVLDRKRLGEPFAMKPTLLRNEEGRFQEWFKEPQEFFNRPILGRGLVVGDLDNDGTSDAVVVSLDSPSAILRNSMNGSRQVTLELINSQGIPAIGATVRAGNGSRNLIRPVVSGGSYLSSSDHSVRISRTQMAQFDHLSVTWPFGKVEVFPVPKLENRIRLLEGQGKPR